MLTATGINLSADAHIRIAPNAETNKTGLVGLDSYLSTIQSTAVNDYIYWGGYTQKSANTANQFTIYFNDYTSTTNKTLFGQRGYFAATPIEYSIQNASWYYLSSAAITSLVFSPSTGTFSAGTVKLYGVN